MPSPTINASDEPQSLPDCVEKAMDHKLLDSIEAVKGEVNGSSVKMDTEPPDDGSCRSVEPPPGAPGKTTCGDMNGSCNGEPIPSEECDLPTGNIGVSKVNGDQSNDSEVNTKEVNGEKVISGDECENKILSSDTPEKEATEQGSCDSTEKICPTPMSEPVNGDSNSSGKNVTRAPSLDDTKTSFKGALKRSISQVSFTSDNYGDDNKANASLGDQGNDRENICSNKSPIETSCSKLDNDEEKGPVIKTEDVEMKDVVENGILSEGEVAENESESKVLKEIPENKIKAETRSAAGTPDNDFKNAKVDPNVKAKVDPVVNGLDNGHSSPNGNDMDVKPDIKPDAPQNVKPEVKPDEMLDIKPDTKPLSDEIKKKRPASPAAPTNGKAKKSRLDSVIGKLGSKLGVSPTDALQNNGESHSSGHSSTSVASSSDSSGDLERQVLHKKFQELMNKKVNDIVQKTQNKIMDGMRDQIKHLTASNDAWKSRVLEMKKQIDELTVLNQRRERRRLRGPTRTVGLQVDEPKAQAAQQGLVKQVGGPLRFPVQTRQPAPAASATVSAPISISQTTRGSVQLIPVASAGAIPPGSAVTLLAPSSLPPASANIGSQIRMIAPPNVANASSVFVPANQPAAFPGNQTVKQMLELKKLSPAAGTTQPKGAGVIDLTDDDDSAKQASKAQVVTVAQQVRPGVVTGLQTGAFFVQGASGPMILKPIPSSQVGSSTPVSSTIMYQRQPAPVFIQGQGGSVRPQGGTVTKLVSAPPLTSVRIPVVTRPPGRNQHPAPLPLSQTAQKQIPGKPMPPKPTLKINRVQQGIVLSWNMSTTEGISDITNYQLFAYQEGAAAPSSQLWKKVGDVKALPLPMACTLTQFQVGNKYHFAVRAVDSFGRVGDFSEASSIHLEKR